MAATSLFELFDCDKSSTLSAVEFCAGICLLREKAASDSDKALVDNFLRAAGQKGGLWDMMAADAGWGADIPVLQLPHLTPALWQSFLDSTDTDEKLTPFVTPFYTAAADIHNQLKSERLQRAGTSLLQATKRGLGGGDFFDLIDADCSGALSTGEMTSTCEAMKKAFPKSSALVSYWELAVTKLYGDMAASAGWPRDTPITQLPHLTRPQFEKFWGEQKVQLEEFAKLVEQALLKKAEVQALAKA